MLSVPPNDNAERDKKNIYGFLAILTKGFFPFLTKEENILKFLQGFCVIFTAMLLFRFSIESYVFDVTPSFAIRAMPAWVSYVAVLVTFAIWCLIAPRLGQIEFFHSILLTVVIGVFYLVIAAPGAYAAKSGGEQQVEQYRHMILDFSIIFIPTNLLGLMWLADAKRLNARFKYIALALVTILILSAISSKGISLKPPSR